MRKIVIAISCLFLASRLAWGAVAQASGRSMEKIVFQDDFETPGPQNPPSGWMMWGVTEYKVAVNYTRDAANSHQGQASLRIHHPANTAGYIVSSPERAIRPAAGHIYTFSFWARSDAPGPVPFRLTAYKSLKPYINVPSTPTWTFQAGPEWSRHEFTLREGLDFFADEAHHLMLNFTASAAREQSRTLWIDDICVSERPDPDPPRLINASSMTNTPLNHRLAPGDRLDCTVDAAVRNHRAVHETGGVSFHRLCGYTGHPYNRAGEYVLPPVLEKAIRELRLPMTRIYGVGDEPFGVEDALDKTADLLQRIGVTQENCVLELETQSAATKLEPEVWARAVRHARERNYLFRDWEIANEPASILWQGKSAFPTPDEFAAHYAAVSRAIREANPRARVGFDLHQNDVLWGNYLLKKLAGSYDFVAPHYYCFARVHQKSFEEITLTENFRMLDKAMRTRALIEAYNPDRKVEIRDTEWGMHSPAVDGGRPDGEPRNGNIIGTLHRAVRLIYYTREGLLSGASSWQLLCRKSGPGFAVTAADAPEQTTMLYWLYYYFNRHVGQWALPIEGSAPYYQPEKAEDRERFGGPLTPVLATLGADGHQLYLVIANGSWTRQTPCRISLRNFEAQRAEGVLLSDGDLDRKPLLSRKEEVISPLKITPSAGAIEFALPPHSVAFITITK